MASQSSAASSGIGIPTVLTIVFVVLKLTGNIRLVMVVGILSSLDFTRIIHLNPIADHRCRNMGEQE